MWPCLDTKIRRRSSPSFFGLLNSVENQLVRQNLGIGHPYNPSQSHLLPGEIKGQPLIFSCLDARTSICRQAPAKRVMAGNEKRPFTLVCIRTLQENVTTIGPPKIVRSIVMSDRARAESSIHENILVHSRLDRSASPTRPSVCLRSGRG